MKRTGLLFSFILMVNVLFAQGIDEGKKFLNYERFESAATVFNKLLAANPNDVVAAYWLGQTYLQNSDNPDTAAAKALYQKTLQANPNAALMMIGVGEVELMEGKLSDAKNRFETAINLTKKRDLDEVLLAVGRANIDAKAGDAIYAVDKLKQAAERNKKSAEIQIALGDAYRKLIDGANATISYQTAMSLDPKNARPNYMIGRIYETQGYGQEAIYMRYYNDAIATDPNFAPVYYWLYGYYYQRDVNKSREYLNKYVAVADQDSKNCYAEASLLYVSKLYSETISKADACIAGTGTAKPFPNLYGLKAYAYDKMGDSLNAKKYFEEFFAKVNPEKIGPHDYATYAKVLLGFPGNDVLAASYVDKAIALDTVPENKLGYVKDIAKSLYDEGKFVEAGKWYGKILSLNPNYGKVDLYYAGYSDYRGGNYKSADSVFQLYQKKYPDDLYGWYLGARSKEGIDTAGTAGLAKPDYEKIIAIADTVADKASIKDKLIPAYRYMVAYYYNVLKNAETANQFNDKILEVDPADATALKTKEAFSSVLKRAATPPAKQN
ncbi:MAG TPA: tetratricopeptide repeat protein [Hanamia sp.]